MSLFYSPCWVIAWPVPGHLVQKLQIGVTNLRRESRRTKILKLRLKSACLAWPTFFPCLPVLPAYFPAGGSLRLFYIFTVFLISCLDSALQCPPCLVYLDAAP